MLDIYIMILLGWLILRISCLCPFRRPQNFFSQVQACQGLANDCQMTVYQIPYEIQNIKHKQTIDNYKQNQANDLNTFRKLPRPLRAQAPHGSSMLHTEQTNDLRCSVHGQHPVAISMWTVMYTDIYCMISRTFWSFEIIEYNIYYNFCCSYYCIYIDYCRLHDILWWFVYTRVCSEWTWILEPRSTGTPVKESCAQSRPLLLRLPTPWVGVDRSFWAARDEKQGLPLLLTLQRLQVSNGFRTQGRI